MSIRNSKDASVGEAELRNERIRGEDEVRELGVVVEGWRTDSKGHRRPLKSFECLL